MRDLNSPHTLGCVGRNNSKSRRGSIGHDRDTRPGQTRKKPKDLSPREREEGGRGEGGGVYPVCDNEKCESGVGVRVNVTIQSETLQVVGLSEVVGRVVRLRKKPMNLCECDGECGVGADVNATIHL